MRNKESIGWGGKRRQWRSEVSTCVKCRRPTFIVTSQCFLRRRTWTGDFKCREVKTGFCRNRSMQSGSSGTLIGWKSGQSTEIDTLHCYKTIRRIPPPSPDDAGLILLGRGKRLLYMGREFAPSGTEVFRNHRKFPAIFTMKKGRTRMVGSNSVPLDY